MRLWSIAAAVWGLSGLLTTAAIAGPTLLFEPASGKILYAEDVDDEWHPA